VRDEQNCPILVWMECCIALTTLAGSLLANLQHRPHRLPQVDARAVTRELLLRYFGWLPACYSPHLHRLHHSPAAGGRPGRNAGAAPALLWLRVGAERSDRAGCGRAPPAAAGDRHQQLGCGGAGGAGGVPLLQRWADVYSTVLLFWLWKHGRSGWRTIASGGEGFQTASAVGRKRCTHVGCAGAIFRVWDERGNFISA